MLKRNEHFKLNERLQQHIKMCELKLKQWLEKKKH